MGAMINSQHCTILASLILLRSCTCYGTMTSELVGFHDLQRNIEEYEEKPALCPPVQRYCSTCSNQHLRNLGNTKAGLMFDQRSQQRIGMTTLELTRFRQDTVCFRGPDLLRRSLGTGTLSHGPSHRKLADLAAV